MNIPGVKSIYGSLKIRSKLAVVFVFLSFMMLVGGGIGYYNAMQAGGIAKNIYTGAFTWFEGLLSIENELLVGRQELLIHIGLEDKGTKEFLRNSIVARRDKVMSQIDALLSGMDVEEDKALLNTLKSKVEDYWKVEKDILDVSDKGDRKSAMRMEVDIAKPAFNSVTDTLRGVINEEKNDLAGGYHQSEYLSTEIAFITVAATIVALLIAFGLWWAMSTSIARPIMIIGESAKRMASGDLSERVAIDSSDELGDLAVEFNKMADALQYHYENLEKKVSERTEDLKAANAELLFRKHELEGTNEELAKASRMKSQFLANVSHELRTPLNSIIGFSELLQEPAFGELNEKQAQYVKYIHGSGGHLLQLINSILDLSKIEAGKMELSKENVVLVELLNEVLATVRPLAQKRDIKVESKQVPASPVISVDKAKFKQIMLNLLSNAVKFNVEGGRVLVDWDIKEELKGTGVGNYLYLSVQDTGIGIKAEDVNKLFREFEQLDPSVTREYGGTGLGLSLTKKLIELHEGEIWVEGEEGKGCRFTVKLPQGAIKLEMLKTTQQQLGASVTTSERPRVLVCAESRDINRLINIYLGESGIYDIVLIEDGESLIEEALKKPPFAIIMGISIPLKDGWEVLKEFKKHDKTKSLPVVIVSSGGDKEIGFALGAVDYLEKPVDKKHLMDALGRLSYTTKNFKKRQTILVVDDEPQILTLLNDILTKENFNVLTAGGGRDAIEIAINSEPDLMILDLMMPEVSGFDVVEKLKEHPIARHIPIIIFTAKEITSEDKVRLGDGIERIIKKAGFTMEQLVAELRLLELAFPDKANMVDPFTKAFNKRYLEVMLPREISRSIRYGHNFSILMLDIDGISIINSKYGRENGDKVIYEMAGVLNSILRKADFVARTGIDEFVVFLPGIAVNEALIVSEKLKNGIREHVFCEPLPKGELTVSIGIVTCPVLATSNLLEKAEALVRAASDAGGNLVYLAKKE